MPKLDYIESVIGIILLNNFVDQRILMWNPALNADGLKIFHVAYFTINLFLHIKGEKEISHTY
jgi:hypothetical protein